MDIQILQQKKKDKKNREKGWFKG